MAGTVFGRQDTCKLGKSIKGGTKRRWACAFILALGGWLSVSEELSAEPPGRLPASQTAVLEPAPLSSQLIAPNSLNQPPAQGGDGPIFFGLERSSGEVPPGNFEQPPVVGTDDDPTIVEQQQGVPQIGQGTQFGDTNVRIFATPDPDAPLVGASVSRQSRVGFLRELNMNATANEESFSYHGGLTLALIERQGFGIGGRVLFGATDYDVLTERQPSFSGDAFMGFRLPSRYGEHWVKGSFFYDWQDHFYKAGPAFAGLFFASEAMPMTVDVALGFGGGDDFALLPANTMLMEVADRDFQIRTGVFLNPNVHVGLTGNFVEFDSPSEYTQYWGVGGFTNLTLGNLRVGLDLTVGEGGVRGFANASWVFGPQPVNAVGPYGGINGQAWMMKPVNRDIALRTRTKGIPTNGVVGNIGLITGTIIFPPRLAIGGDQNNNGVIDPGDTFELDITVTNTSNRTSTSVSVGQNPVIIGGNATLENDLSGENFGDIPPGESRQTDQFSDLNITVNGSATPGSTFTVEFDLVADGQSGRVQLGPFTVGSLANGQVFTATP